MYGYAEADPGTGGPRFATDTIAGTQWPLSKMAFGAEGVATPVTAADPMPVTQDLAVALLRAINEMHEGPHIETASGRMRVLLDAAGGAQTLGTVTTCGTLTSMSQVAGIPANSFIYDSIDVAWSNCIRGRIT